MYTPLDLLSIESWILIASLLALGRYYLHRKWQYFEKLNIPYVTPSVLNFGNLRSAIGQNTAFEYDNENKKKHGPVWGNFVFGVPGITIHDPDILRQIFIKEFNNFPQRQKIFTKVNGKEMNTGLNIVAGDQWKRIRSTMTPTFSTSKLKQMLGTMEWCADNAVDAINRKVENCNGTFNAKEIFSRLSLDIVCSAAFSTKVHSQDDRVKEPEIARQAKRMLAGSILSPLLIVCVIFPAFEEIIGKCGRTLFGKDSKKYFKALTNHVIKKREAQPHHQGHVDFMQLMLDSEISEKKIKEVEKGMTKTEIVGNSMLMFLAGYENTGNTISFVAYNMAQHPDIQTKLQEEIDEMIKLRGKFDYEGVMSLHFLEMCINETLRIYNPVIRNSRYCENEITINGLTIPKNIQVTIPVFGLSRDPEYWDEPEKFKPERMEDMTQIDPMVFQPFGAGPRNCIGMRFAMLEIKMSLAKLLHKFTFKPAENTPKPPLKLKFGLSTSSAVVFNLQAVPIETNE